MLYEKNRWEKSKRRFVLIKKGRKRN